MPTYTNPPTTNNPSENRITNGAAHSAIVDPTTGLVITTLNGGMRVSDVYAPARDIYLDWFFGTDTTNDTLTANVEAAGNWLESSLHNPDARSIVIVNGNASPTYNYRVDQSRNGLSTTDDTYAIIASTGPITAQITRVVLDPAKGYDAFTRLYITPAVGQTGTQLNFKAYLIGRGG